MSDSDDELKKQLEVLARTPDFSAARANARLEVHEAVCAERYTGIMAALERAAISASALHSRLDTVSNRMWLAVTAVCGTAVVALGVVVFHMMTRNVK